MRSIDYSEYGIAPVHKTTPPFNALHRLIDIAAIYAREMTESAYCLLNSDYLKAVTVSSGLRDMLYGITDAGYMIALVPESLGYTMLSTNMDVVNGEYGANWGKLIIEW